MLRIAAACDAGDMIATAITRRQRDVTRLGAALWLAGAGACLAITIGAHGEVTRSLSTTAI